MIKINLATKKKSAPISVDSGAGAEGALGALLAKLRGGGGTPRARAEMGAETKAAVIALVICGALGYGATYFWDSYKQKELQKIADEASVVQSQIQKLDSQLAKTQGYENLKKSLEADEKAIRTKIETIEKLVEERRDPPLILKTLSEVTPKDVWLTDFQMKTQDVKFAGNARGLAPVSDFMKQLEETIYFKEVVLKRSTSKRDQGIEESAFELEAKRR